MITERGPRSVFISGAARGIGRATAELFLSRGWRVGMYDVDTEAVSDAAAGRDRAVPGTLDVRDAGQWRAALGEFCGTGGLDVLINNAGVLASGPFVGMTAEEHRRMVDINVTGVVNGSLEGYPFLERSRGLLLNLCSASSLYGQPTLATYGATKAAVKSLTEALDIEWRARRCPRPQPAAAVRRHRDGLPRRPGGGERHPPRRAADARARRGHGVEGRPRAAASARRAAPPGRPADPADGCGRRGHAGLGQPARRLRRLARPLTAGSSARGPSGDVLARSVGGQGQADRLVQEGDLDALAYRGDHQALRDPVVVVVHLRQQFHGGLDAVLVRRDRDVLVDPGRDRVRVQLRLRPRLPPGAMRCLHDRRDVELHGVGRGGDLLGCEHVGAQHQVTGRLVEELRDVQLDPGQVAVSHPEGHVDLLVGDLVHRRKLAFQRIGHLAGEQLGESRPERRVGLAQVEARHQVITELVVDLAPLDGRDGVLQRRTQQVARLGRGRGGQARGKVVRGRTGRRRQLVEICLDGVEIRLDVDGDPLAVEECGGSLDRRRRDAVLTGEPGTEIVEVRLHLGEPLREALDVDPRMQEAVHGAELTGVEVTEAKDDAARVVGVAVAVLAEVVADLYGRREQLFQVVVGQLRVAAGRVAASANARTSSAELGTDSSSVPRRPAAKSLMASRSSSFGATAGRPQAAVPVRTAASMPPARSRGSRTETSGGGVPGRTRSRSICGSTVYRRVP